MSKTALIMGDSYSTFKGHIPEGYASWYPENMQCGETDVKTVADTWWYQVMQEADLELLLNNSWSGSPIGYTGYNNTDCSHSSSFIYRLNQLIENGFFERNRIDTVLVFGGTNDSCANAPLGEMTDGNETADLYAVLPAICHFFKRLRETLPNAAIYCLINTGLKTEIVHALKEVSRRHGITAVTFEHIDKYWGHPTAHGMRDIAHTVLQALNPIP